jgi:hypothetical protein
VTGQSGFGGDTHMPERMQRLANQVLGHIRTIGISGVNEVNAQFDSPPKHGNSTIVICRWTPDSRACDLHGTESHPVNRKGIGVRTDGELAGGCDRSWGHAHIQQVAGKVGEWGCGPSG